MIMQGFLWVPEFSLWHNLIDVATIDDKMDYLNSNMASVITTSYSPYMRTICFAQVITGHGIRGPFY